MRGDLPRRAWLSAVALSLAWPLGAQADAPQEPAPADSGAASLSEQARSEIESEGVLGAAGAGADTPAGMIVAYQVGAFKSRPGADRLSELLGKSDFVGYLYLKKVDGLVYWVVLVSAANNPFENRADELSKEGFPAIPVSKAELDSGMTLAPGQ